jgi:hypothetical protein
VLAEGSGLKPGVDFAVGYSPERINPGDRQHRFETITKVVSAQDLKTLDIVAAVYGSVVTAGIHRAPSIKVAEAAKVIENTQRSGAQDRYVGCSGRGPHQMELHAVPAGPRRWALHRCRPLLFDLSSRASWVPSGSHPGRPLHQ